MSSPDDQLIFTIRDALAAGRLEPADLSTRRLAALAGKTTSLVYHRYGSLDGLLYQVAQSGMGLLGARLLEAEVAGADLAELAATFVRFGLDAPGLYGLMFQRQFDWRVLRAGGALGDGQPGLKLFHLLGERLRAAGAKSPRRDARMLFAGLHGLVSLALTGRANVGDLETTDEAAAIDAARELARRLCPDAQGRHHGDHRRPARARGRRAAQESDREVGDERAAGRKGRRAP